MEQSKPEKFNNLLNYLLAETSKQKLNEPEYAAINMQSAAKAYLDERWQYINEIRRVLKDLELTVALMQQTKAGTTSLPDGFQQEDLMIYLQGHFLDLVHQMKDKVIKFVSYMNKEAPTKDKFNSKDLKKQRKGLKQDIEKVVAEMKEKGLDEALSKKSKDELIELVRNLTQDDFSDNGFQKLTLKELTSEIEEAKLIDLLSQWDEDDNSSNNGIKVALRKRTQYHHFISTLHLDEDFNKLKSFRTIKQQDNYLSEYGKQFMADEVDKMSKDYLANALTKSSDTLELIHKNIENLAEYFLDKYQINYDPIEHYELLTKEIALKKSFEIKNSTSLALVDTRLKGFLKTAVDNLNKIFGDEVVAVYLVGSVARGEYVHQKSDINLYIIMDGQPPNLEDENQELLRAIKNDIKLFSLDDFLKPENKRHRFICFSDGVLLFGDQIINETFPASGAELTYLMNHSLVEDLKDLRKWAEDQSVVKTSEDVTSKAQEISNKILHFLYGIEDANHPGEYTFSKTARVEKIIQCHPGNRTAVETLQTITFSRIKTVEELLMIIDHYEPIVVRIINKIKEVLGKKDKSNND